MPIPPTGRADWTEFVTTHGSKALSADLTVMRFRICILSVSTAHSAVLWEERTKQLHGPTVDSSGSVGGKARAGRVSV